MATADIYTLNLYSPVLAGQGFIMDMTHLITDWERSIRLQGGFWEGGFTIKGTPAFCNEFFHEHLMAHVEERTGGEITWEGFIAEMMFDSRPPVRGLTSVGVSVLGYVHTASWRHVTGGGDTANEKIENIVTNDCEFLNVGIIRTNAIEVEDNSGEHVPPVAWDELIETADLGDVSSYLPWRVYVNAGRRLNYNSVSATPSYYAQGGLIRRKSLLALRNYILTAYTNALDTPKLLDPIYNSQSIAAWGRREEYLYRDRMKAEGAIAWANRVLNEDAWPWARTAGGSSLTLFVDDGMRESVNARFVQPGVVRDMSIPPATLYNSAFLQDVRDALIEEVVVSEGGKLALQNHEFGDEEFLIRAKMYIDKKTRRIMARQKSIAKYAASLAYLDSLDAGTLDPLSPDYFAKSGGQDFGGQRERTHYPGGGEG